MLASSSPVSAQASPRPGHSRATILVLLFIVLGPLALPVLWRSPRFSLTEKLVLTLAIAILTAIVLWLLWWAVDRFVQRLAEFRAAGMPMGPPP